MTPSWIEIDDEVLAEIQARATAFVDSPNDALRDVFGLAPGERPTCAPVPRADAPRTRSAPPAAGLPRARSGEILSMEDYELPLLRALAAQGGSAPRSTVVEAVEEMLGERLTAIDRGRLQNDEVRWENRLGFARLRAIERGELRGDSRRGIWEMTEAGAERLARADAEEADHEGGVPR
ncbi:MAG: winged helix-turn-helix domain-containing protein [Actinobacteria bacterium]|nr:winged helix-turn-helix domain-containing protein [Actinomycetota bacterium]